MAKTKKQKNSFNRFLRALGLMKIETAKRLSTILHIHYALCVIAGVKEDFDVDPAIDVILREKEWWKGEFIKMVNTGYNDLNIGTPPIFKED